MELFDHSLATVIGVFRTKSSFVIEHILLFLIGDAVEFVTQRLAHVIGCTQAVHMRTCVLPTCKFFFLIEQAKQNIKLKGILLSIMQTKLANTESDSNGTAYYKLRNARQSNHS